MNYELCAIDDFVLPCNILFSCILSRNEELLVVLVNCLTAYVIYFMLDSK